MAIKTLFSHKLIRVIKIDRTPNPVKMHSTRGEGIWRKLLKTLSIKRFDCQKPKNILRTFDNTYEVAGMGQ